MFWRLVWGAVRLRRGRLLLAFSALAVAGTLASALFTIYSGAEKKLGNEFQAYGANVVIAPGTGHASVPLSAAGEVRKLGGVVAPYLYWADHTAGRDVVILGVDWEPRLLGSWHVTGTRGDCMTGVNLGFRPGDRVALREFSCGVTGVIATGAAEDDQVILPFATAARLAGLEGAASLMQARMPAGQIERLAKTLPNLDVRPIRAVAETESNVIFKIRLALFLLALTIVTILTVSVANNFRELVLARSKEVGILKAIGAPDSTIARMFAAESLILAGTATLPGYVLGVLLAAWIGRSVFNASFAIEFHPEILFFSVLTTCLIALFAVSIAARKVWRIQPAVILRGE